ncbi:unnamed protein product, partial [Chrysoparadoxa australica]
VVIESPQALRLPSAKLCGGDVEVEDLVLGMQSLTAEKQMFRLDKDEFLTSLKTSRYNLLRLFAGPSLEAEVSHAASGRPRPKPGAEVDAGMLTGDVKRRALIVNLE